MVANNGLDNSTDQSDQFHNWMVAFSPGAEPRVLLASGWSERGVNLRSVGLGDRKARGRSAAGRCARPGPRPRRAGSTWCAARKCSPWPASLSPRAAA